MKLFELHNQEKVDEAVELIKRDCSFYLKHAPYLNSRIQMWRGISYLAVPFSKQKAKKWRLPLHTPQKLHDSLNNFFVEKFGWPARSGTFVSWDIDTAASYGDLYAIFPIGEFKYVWSPDVVDLYENLTDYLDDTEDAPTLDEIDARLKNYSWKDSGLSSMIPTYDMNELVIDATEYYAMSKSMVNAIAWSTVQ